MKLTSKYIESRLAGGRPYVIVSARDPSVERMNCPFFIKFFNSFVDKGEIPLLEEFVHGYISTNIDSLSGKIQTDEQGKGLVGRLTRTYPSLIRELHLYCMLKENTKLIDAGCEILRNTKLDIGGVDGLIKRRDGHAFAVKIYQNTPTSKFWRGVKDRKENKEVKEDMAVIEAMFDPHKGQEINNYWLFKHDAANTIADRVLYV